ncbi:MAG: DUF308 domain-containing protein [Oscillospiraceae bacterium]|nr:DUF308 domain-containing protein [Oscillospiraceae bacterium]
METKKPSVGLRILTIISCLIMVVAGGYLFFAPVSSIVWVFSAAVLVHGVQLILRYFVDKENRNGWNIVAGIINVIFGCFMLFGRVEDRIMGALTIGIFIGIWAIFAGVSRFIDAFSEMKNKGSKAWIWSLISGILIVICGISGLVYPGAFTVLVGAFAKIFTAAAFIVLGLAGIAGALSSGGKPPELPDGGDDVPPAATA